MPTGALVWGIVPGLRSYIERLPDGLIRADGGAVVTPAALEFPLKPSGVIADAAGVLREVQAGGEIRMLGHGGLLSIVVRNPRLQLFVGGALTADSPWTGEANDSLTIATVDSVSLVREARTARAVARLRLADDGAELLQRYPVGFRVDDVVVSWSNMTVREPAVSAET